MVTRIEIGIRSQFRDPRGEEAAHKMRDFLHLPVERVRTRDVYHLAAELFAGEPERVLHELIDPVLHDGALGRIDDDDYDFAVTVAYKPGVTDPVGKSALVAVRDTLGRELEESAAVYTSAIYLLSGVGRDQAEQAATELLANPVIQDLAHPNPGRGVEQPVRRT